MASYLSAGYNYRQLCDFYPSFYIPPLLLLLLSTLMACGIDGVNAGIMINILCGTITILIVYFLAKNIFNDFKISILSAMFVAVHPTMINYSYEIQREALYLLFSTISLFFIFKTLFSKNLIVKLFNSLCLGISFFLCIISRYEGLLLLPIFFILLFFANYRQFQYKVILYTLFLFLFSAILSAILFCKYCNCWYFGVILLNKTTLVLSILNS